LSGFLRTAVLMIALNGQGSPWSTSTGDDHLHGGTSCWLCLENNQHVAVSVAVFMHHGELAETTVSCLKLHNAAIPETLWMQFNGQASKPEMEQRTSVTSGSVQAMLTSLLSMGHGDWFVRLSRWHPGSPWSGRGPVPGGRFHERL